MRLFPAHPADLLLVSQRAPGLDGAVTIELLAAIEPSLRVIVMTTPALQRVLNSRLSIRVMIEQPSGLPASFGVLRQLLERPRSSLADQRVRNPPAEERCACPTNHGQARTIRKPAAVRQ